MISPKKIRAIDSHTGGEPTRVVTEGFADLGTGSMAQRLENFRRDHDSLRSAIVCEPRGHDAIVGALLCEPIDATAATGVIFFNNVGYLGMCGHGTIGLIKTLEYMGRIGAGVHKIETPVGMVEAELNADGSVTITNVASYRHAKEVAIEVPGEHSLRIDLSNLEQLTDFSVAVRNALTQNNITGEDGAEIDHIELFATTPTADSRNFVLCPGLEYDRSPCGTGTSAKLACLYADGKLRESEIWRQESIVGSVFEGRVMIENGKLIPVIRGTASITAELELILDENDPYRFGLTA
jgi:4-hydroxyproline epimerase